ncbi:MAG: roadblock/LC7 domain-containing protein [Thiotrichales bacterium]
MSAYKLIDQFFLQPTSAGAFYAVTGDEPEPLRRLLLALLAEAATPRVDLPKLCYWLGVADDQQALHLLHQAQTLAWVQGYREPRNIVEAGIGRQLQDPLRRLSSVGKALLVDGNGFPLARHGLDDATVDALSALSADLAAVQTRHAARLKQCLKMPTQGWGALDAFGSSRIAVWPLFVGARRLLLVVLGEPRLSQPEFITLVWMLINRYGSKLNGGASDTGLNHPSGLTGF